MTNLASNILRVRDIWIKEINLSLCPPLWVFALSCYGCKCFLSFLQFSDRGLLGSLLLCLALKFLVQIVEHIKVVTDIEGTVCVDNWIIWLSLDHSTLVIVWYALRRGTLNANIMLFALDVDNVSNYVMFAGELSIFAVFLYFLTHNRVCHLGGSHCAKILMKVRLSHACVTKLQLQMIIVSSTIEKLFMIFSLRGMILSSFLYQLCMINKIIFLH